MTKGSSRRGGVYRLSEALTDQQVAATREAMERELSHPLDAVRARLEEVERTALAICQRHGLSVDPSDAGCPERVRDAAEPDSELMFAALLFKRVRDARTAMQSGAAGFADGFLIGQGLAMQWSAWRAEWSLGPMIGAGRAVAQGNAARSSKSAEARRGEAKRCRALWLTINAELDPYTSADHRARIVAKRLKRDDPSAVRSVRTIRTALPAKKVGSERGHPDN